MGLWLLLACCLLKFVFIAVFVIPPWDVADEVGHLAFIKHLATGNGIPVLMETKVDEGMWNAIAGNTELPPGHNWIAQHPPLYYLIMIPSYWVGDFLGDSVEYPLFAGRVCNGFMMVLALFILYRMIKLYSDNDLLALSIVAMVASIPMVSQTAAGVTNDSLVLLLSVVLTWRWMCFYRTLSKRDLILVGLILGLCGITKYTLLPGIAAVSAFVVLYLIQQKQASTKLVVMFLCWAWLPLLGWVIRNYIILGHGLPADIDFELSGQPTHFTVIEFLTVYPFFTQLFGTFFGIFGWYGSGQDLILTSFHLPLFYQFLYALLVTLLGTVSLWFLFLESKFFRKKSAVFSFVGGGLTSVAVYQFDLFSAESFFVSWILYLSLFSILFAVAFGSTRIWLTTKPCCDWRERIEFESILVCGFFLLILFFKLYNLSNEKGQLRGTHGRYFFSVLGFLLLAWIVPGLSKLSRGPLLALPLALLMTAAEYCIWVGEVIPFFESR